MLKQITVGVALSSFLLAIGLTLSGCGKQEFVKQIETASFGSFATRMLPAKVDIVIVTDNSASMNVAFAPVKAQLTSFAGSLVNQNWDYHFGRLSMIGMTQISQAMVNGTYNNAYLPDGTVNFGAKIVPSYAVVSDPSQFTLIENAGLTGAGDRVYQPMINTLNSMKSAKTINFLRDDAPLAVIVLTNGYESTVTDGYATAISPSPLANYASQLAQLKGGNSSQVRFYPVASYSYATGNNTSYCLQPGVDAFAGNSYFSMNNYLRGVAQNFCDASGLNNVLAKIDADLQAVRQSYIYSYLVLDRQPDSINSIVYQGRTIPANDAVNGWTYEGGPKTVYAVESILDQNGNEIPAIPKLNQQTGYVIHLHGKGRIIGNPSSDELKIDYTNK